MSVIPLTVFFSLLLAGLFIALFVHEQRRRRFASAERDSLLPLADETPQAVAPTLVAAETDHDDHAQADHAHHAGHDHDHVHDHDDDHEHTHDANSPCGCRNGTRPPCVGCLRFLNRTAGATSLAKR